MHFVPAWFHQLFFLPHVCEEFLNNGIDFHALDLRKYGRSILPNQHPNYCLDMEEYFEDIDIAIRQIQASSGAPIVLLGFSTGGLLASGYMNGGKERSCIGKLILNSPFLEFNQSKLQRKMTQFAAWIVSFFLPYSKVDGALSTVYAKSVHKGFIGEWDFNLAWKPIEGFPTYFKRVMALARAQKKLLNSNIEIPVLVMHSSRSKNFLRSLERSCRPISS